MKDSKYHYHFYDTPPKYYDQQHNPAKREDMLKRVITDYITAMEEKVKQYPYQWFNYYNFWKT